MPRVLAFSLFIAAAAAVVCKTVPSEHAKALLYRVPVSGYFMAPTDDAWVSTAIEPATLPDEYHLDEYGQMRVQQFNRSNSRLILWGSIWDIPMPIEDDEWLSDGRLLIDRFCDNAGAVSARMFDRQLVLFPVPGERMDELCESARNEQPFPLQC